MINIYIDPDGRASNIWVCDGSLDGITSSNPEWGEAWIRFHCKCCVLLGRGLCNGTIACPEELCYGLKSG